MNILFMNISNMIVYKLQLSNKEFSCVIMKLEIENKNGKIILSQ